MAGKEKTISQSGINNPDNRGGGNKWKIENWFLSLLGEIGALSPKTLKFSWTIVSHSFLIKTAIFCLQKIAVFLIYTNALDSSTSLIKVLATVCCSSLVSSGNIGSDITISVFFSVTGKEPLPIPK